MRSDIRNIRTLAKGGAYGQSHSVGYYIYGKRQDGRTVPCKSEVQEDGSIQIWSDRIGQGHFVEQDMTEFTKEEWAAILSAPDAERIRLGNEILRKRDAAQPEQAGA